MRSPSSLTYSVSRSPHSGLKPSACAIGRIGHRAEIPRVAVVIDDHVAIEVLEVHQPSISPRAAERRDEPVDFVARVVERQARRAPSRARSKKSMTGIAQ